MTFDEGLTSVGPGLLGGIGFRAMGLCSGATRVTGVLFAQFVDQGLIGIDDPVGKYLPDFPVTGSNVLTLRHCFTHATAGLQRTRIDCMVVQAIQMTADRNRTAIAQMLIIAMMKIQTKGPEI